MRLNNNKKGSESMTNKKRFVAGLTAALFLAVILSFSFVIALEAGHECIGENCGICLIISACENVLESAGCAAAVILISAAVLHTVCRILKHFAKVPSHRSLISLKVKLSY